MNTYADAIRRQADDAPRAALPAVASALWRAYAEGHVTEAEAETLAAHIEVRRLAGAVRNGGRGATPTGTPAIGVADTAQDSQNRPRTGAGSRPRTDASLERRRRWAASGRLSPAIAARFTLAEQAALALVAAETARKGDCRLAIEHMAAVAGVSRSTVKTAIREARKLGLLTVEERKVTGWRNDTNIIRVVSSEWTAWLRLARRSSVSGSGLSLRREQKGGGVKSPTATSTQIPKQGKTRRVGVQLAQTAGLSLTADRSSRAANA